MTRCWWPPWRHPAAVVAGVVFTVDGLGGGVALITALSLIVAPNGVIGFTEPVLLIGINRAWMFRKHRGLLSGRSTRIHRILG